MSKTAAESVAQLEFEGGDQDTERTRPSRRCLVTPQNHRLLVAEPVYILKNLLGPAECRALIAAAEETKFRRHHSNSRDQIVFESPSLTDVMATRLVNLVPQRLEERTTGRTWHFTGLNCLWRITRYNGGNGDKLGWHCDAPKRGISHRDKVVRDTETDASSEKKKRKSLTECHSAFTLTVYLNDVPAAHGGRTEFKDLDIEDVQPAAGSAMVLNHNSVHCGATLTDGYKYILRGDILYTPSIPTTADQLVCNVMCWNYEDYHIALPDPAQDSDACVCWNHVPASDNIEI